MNCCKKVESGSGGEAFKRSKAAYEEEISYHQAEGQLKRSDLAQAAGDVSNPPVKQTAAS